MSRWRSIIVVLLLVAITAGGYAYWRRGQDGAQGEYVTEAVERGAIASIVTATGTVNPVTTVQVGTYVSGPIQALYVDFNSPVKKGQLVAKIDPAPFQVKVLQAQADVANARARVDKDRADLQLKKVTLARNRELLKKNLISQNDLDTALSNYDQAVAQLALDAASIQQTEAALQAAQINLDYTEIRSPVDGVVVSRSVDVGQTVAASFQTPTLFLIAQDLTKMQVDTSVSESDIGAVGQGQPATFTVDAYPGRPFHGTVAQVRNAPVTVQNVVTYDVVVAVDNPKLELKPGMTANVNVTTAERQDALKIPLRAVRFNPERKPGAEPTQSQDGSEAAARRERHGSTAVWVMQPDGSLQKIDVKLGIRNDQYAEVLSDHLDPGAQLAVAFRRGTQRAETKRPPSFPGGGRH